MHDVLERLRERGLPLHPPANADELRSLEDAIGHPLPEQVTALYVDHGGADESMGVWIRLMTPGEAAAATTENPEVYVELFDEGDYRPRALFERSEFALFWTDDNGNFAGVFMEGPLEGCVFVFDHDGPGPVPVWESVRNFYLAFLETDEPDFQNLPQDFPRGATAVPDRWDELAGELFAIHQSQPETSTGIRAAQQALVLCSRARVDEVRALLGSSDMWIQAAAVDTLWRWGLADVEDLIEVVVNGTHNGRLAAKRVLLKIPDDRGLRAVAEDESAYWAEVEERTHDSPLRRVDGLVPSASIIRAFRSAIWWVGIRLAFRDFGAPELHAVPGVGLTGEEIAAALDRPELPEAFVADGTFSGLGVGLVSEGPLTLAVTVPFWRGHGTVVLVADLLLVERDGHFDVAIESIREPKFTAHDGRVKYTAGDL